MSEEPDLAATAKRHGLSLSAAQALFDALVSGGGGMAQFSHPELGGMGQWSRGMTQIGDMFNDALKGRIGAFCQEMSGVAAIPRRGEPPLGIAADETRRTPPLNDVGSQAAWWPAHLGTPSSSGSQNDMRYACFPDQRRLAIRRGDAVVLYDTGEHRLTGFSQQQSTRSDLSFSSETGPVALDNLRPFER